MSGHTKGPWEFDGEYVWADSVKGYVADPNMEDVPNAEEREANGRLIAAAPEMLEALILMRDNPSDNNLNYPEVCAAILKATGGAE